MEIGNAHSKRPLCSIFEYETVINILKECKKCNKQIRIDISKSFINGSNEDVIYALYPYNEKYMLDNVQYHDIDDIINILKINKHVLEEEQSNGFQKKLSIFRKKDTR